MKIYKYDTQTKEFIQELEINEAYGINLPFSTTVKPLTEKDGFAVVFDGARWEYIEDNRDKTVYVKDTKQELRVDYLGKIKDDVTTLKPEQFDIWDYETNKWVCDEVLKNEFRIQAINSKQDEIITKRDMYPLYKQLNIDNQLEPYTLDDKEIKNMFISTVRLIGRQAKEDGTLIDDINWAGLDKIESPSAINFETTKAIKDRLLNAN